MGRDTGVTWQMAGGEGERGGRAGRLTARRRLVWAHTACSWISCWFTVRPSDGLERQRGCAGYHSEQAHPGTSAGSRHVCDPSGGPGRELTGTVGGGVLVLGLVMLSLLGGSGRREGNQSGRQLQSWRPAACAAVQGRAPQRRWAGIPFEAGREAYSPPRRRPGPRSGPSAAAERGPGRPAEGGEREGSKGLGGQPARRGSPLLWRSPARAPLPLCSADQPRLTPACLRPRGGVLATRGLGLAWGGCRTVSGAAEQVAEGCRTRGMARMGRGVATWRLLPEADLPQHAARRFGSLPSCAARFLPAWRRRRSSACTAASGMTP